MSKRHVYTSACFFCIGAAPTDPGIGFLPPNNGTSGQGFVTFTIKAKEDTPHLAVIHANASIFFDANEPIDTPDIFNTVRKLLCFVRLLIIDIN